ncbi:hypothetical protein FRC02_009165 [Tulasnella sp. 418]|nr:hypothetical protein FRC02_009165 [Tulasnella sp. 418]
MLKTYARRSPSMCISLFGVRRSTWMIWTFGGGGGGGGGGRVCDTLLDVVLLSPEDLLRRLLFKVLAPSILNCWLSVGYLVCYHPPPATHLSPSTQYSRQYCGTAFLHSSTGTFSQCNTFQGVLRKRRCSPVLVPRKSLKPAMRDRESWTI